MKNTFMKSLVNGIIVTVMTATATTLVAAEYKVPPSSTTYGSVPVISDRAMEACVKLYNHAEWLKDEINTLQVDRYSQNSIDNYNNKVARHSNMIHKFNNDCAGKQSRSAYEAAQKLNNNI